MSELDEVKRLLEALQQADPVLRTDTIRQLLKPDAIVQLGKEGASRAVDPLIKILQDNDEYTRGLAVLALGKIGDTRAVEPLVLLLKRHQDSVSNLAVMALTKFGSIAVPHLLAALQSNFVEERMFAAVALGKIGDQKAVDSLIGILEKEQEAESVQREAAVALGNLNDKQAVETLITSLKDEYPELREAAAEALGKLSDDRAIEPLAKLLKTRNSRVRFRVAWALSKFGDTRAIAALISSLKLTFFLDRKEVIEALGVIGDETALPALKKIQQTDLREIRISETGEIINITKLAGAAIAKIRERIPIE